MSASPLPDIAPEDQARADLYDFLATLLARPPDAALLARIAASAGTAGDDSDLGRAIGAVAAAAKSADPIAVRREFNGLFIGLGRGELMPYASFYLTGFLNEKPLATLRADMARGGMARADDVFEPEDNIASLAEMMAAQITGRFGRPASLAAQRTFFQKHVAPWAGHFFADLEGAKLARFYAPVGTLGRRFMDIEREAFRLVPAAAAPPEPH